MITDLPLPTTQMTVSAPKMMSIYVWGHPEPKLLMEMLLLSSTVAVVVGVLPPVIIKSGPHSDPQEDFWRRMTELCKKSVQMNHWGGMTHMVSSEDLAAA